MKLAIDKPLELEFEPWSIATAEKCLAEIRSTHKESADRVLRGVLTLLLFAQLEQQHPGSVARIKDAVDRCVAALNGPQPEKT